MNGKKVIELKIAPKETIICPICLKDAIITSYNTTCKHCGFKATRAY